VFFYKYSNEAPFVTTAIGSMEFQNFEILKF